jgi:uncharacterized Zn finger protein
MPTVDELVARFHLRRNASTDAFHGGVRLARARRVSVIDADADRVAAQVYDDHNHVVELRVERGDLVAHCSCSAATDVCRHAVAVAHLLWMCQRHAAAGSGPAT